MLKKQSILSLVLMVVLLCCTLTGCTFNFENNIGKSALEYNTEKLGEIMDISLEKAEKVAYVLEEQGFGKIVSHTSAILNGEGNFTVSDMKNKYVFVVENSILTRLETKDGELVRDLSNLANEEFSNETSIQNNNKDSSNSTEKQESVKSIESLLGEDTQNERTLEEYLNGEQVPENRKTVEELFSEDDTNSVDSYKYGWSTLRNLNNGIVESIPNGGLTEDTVLYNLGGRSLRDLHAMMVSVNPSFNVRLFDNIYAATVIEENWASREAGISEELGRLNEQGYAILAMLTADKFDDMHYNLERVSISTTGSNEIYLDLTDGSTIHKMVYVPSGTDLKITVDGVDYTDKIFNETQLLKYYDVMSVIQLEDSVSSIMYSDREVYESLTDNPNPTQELQYTTGKLSTIQTISKSGYNLNEIERAIETYYGCSIKNIEITDIYDGEYEGVDIFMENGKECRYTWFVGELGGSVFDNCSTFETIWASWE